MNNRVPLEKAIIKEMGEGTVVEHKVGIPFTVVSSIDGKEGKKECLPGYYNTPSCLSEMCCKSALEKTAKYAKEIGGAPTIDEMER